MSAPAAVGRRQQRSGRRGQWLRYLVGTCELLAVVGLLVPRLVGAAALGLVGLMLGATLTNVVVLDASPVLTIALLVASAVVARACSGQARSEIVSPR